VASFSFTVLGCNAVPHWRTTSSTSKPYTLATLTQRSPNLPPLATNTFLPRGTRQAMAASMPAVPEPAMVSASFRVWSIFCSPALTSANILRNRAVRW